MASDGAAPGDPSTTSDEVVTMSDFAAPTALPPVWARATAFTSIIVAAFCGGVVGYAVIDFQCTGDCGPLALLGAVGGALLTSVGTAIIAVLVLRAMSEWEDQASVRAR